ncbi:MAG: hypothetical protein A2029_11055 [Chloroflexi bacterium RBG_19FT_COMBO_47_9]|nr:MAG: hypothetical protein A2029_11055 [Chloroflexi bacterium RBG_19FT_COMBO_47_9]
MDLIDTSPNAKKIGPENRLTQVKIFLLYRKKVQPASWISTNHQRAEPVKTPAPLYIGANDEASKANKLRLKESRRRTGLSWISKRYEKSGAVAVHNPEKKTCHSMLCLCTINT